MFILLHNIVLEYYKLLKPTIDIIKDFVFVAGFITFYKFAKNYSFNKKKEEIDISLEMQERIEEQLYDYFLKEYKNKIRDISVRFIYCKNFPSNLNEDGFKHILYYHCYMDNIPPTGFIDRKGINFSFHPWFYGDSIYIDRNGIFFIDKKDKKYRNFYEIKGRYQIVQNLPFVNIVNFDFKNYIEYEPILYIKYKYTSRKLYRNELFVVPLIDEEKDSNIPYYKYLKRDNWIKKYHGIKHLFLIFKNSIKNILHIRN